MIGYSQEGRKGRDNSINLKFAHEEVQTLAVIKTLSSLSFSVCIHAEDSVSFVEMLKIKSFESQWLTLKMSGYSLKALLRIFELSFSLLCC